MHESVILLSGRVSEVQSCCGGERGSGAGPGLGPRGLLLPGQVESKLVVVYLPISILITPGVGIAENCKVKDFGFFSNSLFHKALQFWLSDCHLHVPANCTNIFSTDTTSPAAQVTVNTLEHAVTRLCVDSQGLVILQKRLSEVDVQWVSGIEIPI